jgi:hypothetical protein
MKGRWQVIVVIHGDANSVESGDFRHGIIYQICDTLKSLLTC